MKGLIKYIFLTVITCFYSCEEGLKTKKDFETVIYDGCEYIYAPLAGYKSLTHKGNCKNH